MISLTEFYLSDKSKQAQMIIDSNSEIIRLNNIINDLINYIGQEWYCFDNESIEFYVAKDILNKLQELKGSDKEWIKK